MNVSGHSLHSITVKEKGIHASVEYTAHFHVQVEKWPDRDEIVPQEKDPWQSL